MPWIRVDDDMPHHPKIAGLSDPAFRWVFLGLSYANRFLTNGDLPALFLGTCPEPIQRELVASGVWKSRRGRVVIHDYLEYQPTKAEVRDAQKKNRDRQTRFRKRLQAAREVTPASRVSNGVTNGVPIRHVTSRHDPTKRSPKPPSVEGGVKVVRADREEAKRQRAVVDCAHETRCESFSLCVERMAVAIARKRLAIRVAS